VPVPLPAHGRVRVRHNTEHGAAAENAGVRRPPLWAAAVIVAALALAAALLARLFVIESPEFGWACQGTQPPWWCSLRTGTILTLRAGALGFLSLGAGLVALWHGWPRVAILAIATGIGGLVLYGPEAAAGGVLLGALALVRA
jgi:hypothetical protein